MRADQDTVNGLTTYKLGTSETSTALSAYQYDEPGLTWFWGIRFWKRHANETETEITSGFPVANVSTSAEGKSILNNTWNCPETALESTDSVVARVYGWKSGGTPTLLQSFTTEQLTAESLSNADWNIFYVVYISWYSPLHKEKYAYYWGHSAYPSRIENFTWSSGVPPTYSVTFYFYEGGTILVNGTSKSNGTEIEYSSDDVVNITAVHDYSYAFKNHTYDGSSTTDNPFYLTVTQDYTTHTYFRFLYDCNYIGLNATHAGESSEFSSGWEDLYNAEGLSHYLLSTNNTESWTNGTWKDSWVSTWWAEETVTLNATSELTIAFRFYVNDTSGNEYVSTICFFTTYSNKTDPVARFSYSPSNPGINNPITFTATDSLDPDGGALASYSWDFGDDTSDTGETVSKTYTDPDIYTVTLTVTDDEGATDNHSLDIKIESPGGIHNPPEPQVIIRNVTRYINYPFPIVIQDPEGYVVFMAIVLGLVGLIEWYLHHQRNRRKLRNIRERYWG